MITLDRRKEVEGLYLAARALPPGPERDRVLAESNPELRDEVEALLARIEAAE